jgi:CelD/BcsL family acetyltransferase involved in cellulose biosynthesis
MSTIRESTDVHEPVATARAHWHGFVNEMMSASQPDQQWLPLRWRRVEKDSDRDVVQFESIGPCLSRMTVEFDEPGEEMGSFAATRMQGALRRDLKRFCAGGECELSRAA